MKPPLTTAQKLQRRHAGVLAASLGALVTIQCESELEAQHLATDVSIDISSPELVERCDREAMFWEFTGGGSLSIHFPQSPHAHFRLPVGAA